MYLGNSYARQVNLQQADKRIASYGRLWALTEVARPTRIKFEDNPLSPNERRSLFEALTRWYYADGNGMLLGGVTKSVYIAAKDNLVCKDEDLQPKAVRHEITGLTEQAIERRRGEISTRQLSLMRTQMKTDLAIYGRPFGPKLEHSDEAFLRSCGVQLWRRPWREARRDTESADTPYDGHAYCQRMPTVRH